MSTTSLTEEQLQQVEQVLAANQDDPAAVWAILAGMGDQYAAAAFQGLPNSSSLYYQVIQNSNLVSGVTFDEFNNIAINNVEGYVGLLESASKNLNANGTISLPTTTAIEKNYYNAVLAAGVNDPTAAIDLCIAKLCQAGLLDGQNWYNGFFGAGLNLDPARIGPPSSVLNNISVAAAAEHFIETTGLTVITEGANGVTPTPLNTGEAAMLAAAEALVANPGLLNGGDLVDPTLNPQVGNALVAGADYLYGAEAAGSIGGSAPTSGSSALSGNAVEDALAEILIQYAGDQATTAAQNAGDAAATFNSVFAGSASTVLSIDLNPVDWTQTYAQTTPTILGEQPFLDAVTANLFGVGASTSVVDTYLAQEQPVLIEATPIPAETPGFSGLTQRRHCDRDHERREAGSGKQSRFAGVEPPGRLLAA